MDSLAEQLELTRATFTPGDPVVYITTDNYAVEGVVADPVAHIDHRCYLIRIDMTNGDATHGTRRKNKTESGLTASGREPIVRV